MYLAHILFPTGLFGPFVSCFKLPFAGTIKFSYSIQRCPLTSIRNCGDQTVLKSSYLHNGISYPGKMVYLYWISLLMPCIIWIPTINIEHIPVITFCRCLTLYVLEIGHPTGIYRRLGICRRNIHQNRQYDLFRSTWKVTRVNLHAPSPLPQSLFSLFVSRVVFNWPGYFVHPGLSCSSSQNLSVRYYIHVYKAHYPAPQFVVFFLIYS